MLVTDEEARTKRCCGPEGCGRHLPSASAGETIGGLGRHTERFCIGSDCMAWEWGEPEYECVKAAPGEPPPYGEGWERIGEYSHPTGTLQYTSWRRPLPSRGYCPFARPRG
jgi:hypothetical protein